jgi:2'-5' RNA ligase
LKPQGLAMTDQPAFPGFEETGRPARPTPARRPTVAVPGVFFAIQPVAADLPPVEAAVSGLRRRHGTASGPVKSGRLHVTCAELRRQPGEPADAVIERAKRVASELSVSTFDMVFSRAMRFKAGDRRPLVLLEQDGPSALKRFLSALGQALERAEVAHRVSRNPHMTLGYGGGDVDEPLSQPIRWAARELVLIRRLWGQGKHEHLGRWPWEPKG